MAAIDMAQAQFIALSCAGYNPPAMKRSAVALKIQSNEDRPILAKRFRGYLPVIVDIETAGFDPKKNAILEIAAVIVHMDGDGRLVPGDTYASHVTPFSGATLDPSSLQFNGIDPYHPFRFAVDEKEALLTIFRPVRAAIKGHACTRAILVGHNPAFDIGFLNAAVKRTGIKRNPFHPFSTFDTATLGGLAYGQTVLAKMAKAAGIDWDNEQAHSAAYDAERTAELFCGIINRWEGLLALESDARGDGLG